MLKRKIAQKVVSMIQKKLARRRLKIPRMIMLVSRQMEANVIWLSVLVGLPIQKGIHLVLHVSEEVKHITIVHV